MPEKKTVIHMFIVVVLKLSAEQLMAFFSGCGEIRYVRMSGDDTQPTR